MKTKFNTFNTILLAILYFAFGIWSLSTPMEMLNSLGIQMTGNNALMELRGNYGGINTLVGVIGFLSIYRKYLRTYFLFVCIVLNFGYVYGRGVSFFLDPRPDTSMYYMWAFEFCVFLLSAYTFKWEKCISDSCPTK